MRIKRNREVITRAQKINEKREGGLPSPWCGNYISCSGYPSHGSVSDGSKVVVSSIRVADDEPGIVLLITA